MKFIKNHLMFILPLMAILLGVEFYLVFDRTTDSYEKGLKEGYSMLVVSHKPVSLKTLQGLNEHISSSEKIKRKSIVSEIAKGVSKDASKEILDALPHFYSVRLDSYLGTSTLEEIKKDLEAHPNIKSVETFGSSYSSSYRLFSFIKLSLKIFIVFMAVVSLFLIIKQMEIWKYAHHQRMQVMEIFGAPLMLRSGVLFKVAIVDAIIAAILTSLFFLYLKFQWAANSGIDMMIQNKEALFKTTDIAILIAVALAIVIVAVYTVVFSSKGVEE
ncbi:MAG TPA: cell division protein FtsX [Epsilonproteobacteria bacterium]|nr:cell division protein FtsX [Campylobacterota bacterium]HHD78534.1 cell division protein FtsX [Campylobacterota bacterium]